MSGFYEANCLKQESLTRTGMIWFLLRILPFQLHLHLSHSEKHMCIHDYFISI